MNSTWAFALVGGAGVYATAVYASLMYYKGVKAAQNVAEGCEPGCACRERAFDGLGDSYDASIGWDEFFMGIGLLRWTLVSRAQGQVLEVSAGTGRNLRYYGAGVSSVVFTDVSYDMLRKAKLKWESGARAYAAAFVLSDAQALVRQSEAPQEPTQAQQRRMSSSEGWRTWLWRRHDQGAAPDQIADAQSSAQQVPRRLLSSANFDAVTLTNTKQFCFREGQFDTVVDTFGLCSCRDPARAVQQMAQVLKPGGRLLLLEHGRSTWQWLNNILDADAAQRYSIWGCWWNRDVLAALEGAGLHVEAASRWHFGTTYFVVARVPFHRG